MYIPSLPLIQNKPPGGDRSGGGRPCPSAPCPAPSWTPPDLLLGPPTTPHPLSLVRFGAKDIDISKIECENSVLNHLCGVFGAAICTFHQTSKKGLQDRCSKHPRQRILTTIFWGLVENANHCPKHPQRGSDCHLTYFSRILF